MHGGTERKRTLILQENSEPADGDQSGSVNRLEETRGTVRELLDVALTESRGRTDCVEQLADDDAVRAAIIRELEAARHTAHLSATDSSMCVLRQHPNHPLKRVLQRRVSVSQLYASESALYADSRQFLVELTGLGSKIRISHQPLHTMALIDGRVAILRTSLCHEGELPILTRLPAVLNTLHSLYQAAWKPAVRLNDYLTYYASDSDEVTPGILRELNSGATDVVAARKLDLSVRTYRRRVAEVMRMLDARSRFQAGVRAAELGLIHFSK